MLSVTRLSLHAACLTLLLAALPQPVVAGTPRIVTLAPNMAEMVYAAGAGEQLAGTVDYSDYPPAARDVPRVGDAFRVDYERLRMMQPDLIIAWRSGTPAATVEALQAQGYDVAQLDATSLDDVAVLLERIGELAGRPEEAAAAAAEYRAGVADLRNEFAARDRLSVFYQISADPWYTFGGGHVVNELIELCGGRNVFADLPALAPQVDLEAILRSNPDVILNGSAESGSAWQQRWQRWDFVAAVAAGRLYTVNPDLVARSTPRLVAGGRQICEALADARGD